jgi:5-hydroxyisourate hydrolase-like protein (transthyretin family)
MVKRISVAVVAALGIATLVAGPVTTASAGTSIAAPVVTEVSVNPGQIVVKGSETVKVTFTAVTKDETPTSPAPKVTGWLKPEAGAETAFELSKDADLGSGQIRWKSTKDFNRQSAPGAWTFKAGVGSPAKSTGFTVKQVYETDFDDIAATPSVVNAGGWVTLSGVLRENGANGWAAVPNAKVDLAFRPLGGSYGRLPGSVETNGQGKFWLKARASRTGHWRAEYDGSATRLGARSETDRVDVRAQVRSSRIVGFGVRPDPVTEGDRLSVGGRLQLDTRRGWDGYGGQKVSILFRADGSSRWGQVGSDWTNRDGRFDVDATARRSGHWRAEFRGADGVKGSGSNTDHVAVRRPAPEPERAASRVTGFNASPEPARYRQYLRFTGKLQVDDGSWEGYRAKVALYFKATGSTKWRYVKTTSANGSGKLYTKTRTYGSGYWKFVFNGDDDFYGDSSRSDYVRVRR